MKKPLIVIAAIAMIATGCRKEIKKKCWHCRFVFHSYIDTNQRNAFDRVDTVVCDQYPEEIVNFRVYYEEMYKKSRRLEYMTSSSTCTEMN